MPYTRTVISYIDELETNMREFRVYDPVTKATYGTAMAGSRKTACDQAANAMGWKGQRGFLIMSKRRKSPRTMEAAEVGMKS